MLSKNKSNWFELGLDLCDKHDVEIKYYTWHIRDNPDHAASFDNRSQAYCDLGYYELALEDAEKAVYLNSESAYSYRNKANALIGLGKINNAKDVLRKGMLQVQNNIELLTDRL